jgi:hypothetical protein
MPSVKSIYSEFEPYEMPDTDPQDTGTLLFDPDSQFTQRKDPDPQQETGTVNMTCILALVINH